MKTTFKKLVFGAIVAVPLFLVPAQSKAGLISDLLRDLFGKKDDHKAGTPAPTSGNSVPVNGGLTILLVAGLGLGTKLMYDKNKKQVKQAII